jgi:hypothetical protein
MSLSITGRCPVNMNIPVSKIGALQRAPHTYNYDFLENVCKECQDFTETVAIKRPCVVKTLSYIIKLQTRKKLKFKGPIFLIA